MNSVINFRIAKRIDCVDVDNTEMETCRFGKMDNEMFSSLQFHRGNRCLDLQAYLRFTKNALS